MNYEIIEYPEGYRPYQPETDRRLNYLQAVVASQPHDITRINDVDIPQLNTPVDEQREKEISKAASFQINALATALLSVSHYGPELDQEFYQILGRNWYYDFMSQPGINGGNPDLSNYASVAYYKENGQAGQAVLSAFFEGKLVRQTIFDIPGDANFPTRKPKAIQEIQFFYTADNYAIEIQGQFNGGSLHIRYLQPGPASPHMGERAYSTAVVTRMRFGSQPEHYLRTSGDLEDEIRFVHFVGPLSDATIRAIDLYINHDGSYSQLGSIQVQNLHGEANAVMETRTKSETQVTSRIAQTKLDSWEQSAQDIFDQLAAGDATYSFVSVDLTDFLYSQTYRGIPTKFSPIMLGGIGTNDVYVSFLGEVYIQSDIHFLKNNTFQIALRDSDGRKALRFAMRDGLIRDVEIIDR